MDHMTMEHVDIDKLDPELQEAVAKLTEAVADAVKAFTDVFSKLVKEAATMVVPTIEKWEEIAVKPCVPGKLWHLYKHGKSYRVRKKNSKRVYSAFWEGEK